VVERIRRAGQVSWAVLGLAALVGLVGYVGWFVRVIWPPLVLGGAIVFLLNPIVTALHRRRIPRVLGVSLTYLAFIMVVGLSGLAVVPLVSDQAEELADEWPEIRENAEDWINDLSEDSEDWFIQVPSVGEIEEDLSGSGEGDTISERIDDLRDIGGRVFHVLLILVLAPIIAFYLLIDLPRLRRSAESLIPEGSRQEVLVVSHRLNRAIGGYFRGQLMVAFIVGVLSSIGLAILDLPFWLLVGMIAGFFNLIPLIGPWVGAVPGILIALTTRDLGTAIGVGVVMAVVQQIDNHFISPLVMRQTVKLHPAAVMLALVAGGTLGGFFGLLIAVPTTATIKIIASHLWRTYVLGEPIEEVARHWEEEDRESGGIRTESVAPEEEPPSEGEEDGSEDGKPGPDEEQPAEEFERLP